MSDELVTKELCDAKMAYHTLMLEGIAENAKAGKEVGGKIMQRLFETGNGGDAMDVAIKRNTDFRTVIEEERKDWKRHRWRRNLGWVMFGISSVVSGVFLALKYLVG